MNTESVFVRIFSTAARVLLVFVTYAFLLLVTTSVVSIAGPVRAITEPQPGLEQLQGLPLVALASAGLVSWIVLRSRWSGTKLALGLGLAFFGMHTVLPELDALLVPGSHSGIAGGTGARWLGGALFAATFAMAAVVILRRTTRSAVAHAPSSYGASSIVGDTVKVAVAATLQLILHAGFGCRWGWYPMPEGLAFRGPFGVLCPDLDTTGMIGAASAGGFELVRASLWAVIGLVLVRQLSRGAVETALVVGAFFALAAPVRQLLPYPLVPGEWAVEQRWAIGTSQLAMGVTLALWFSWQGPGFSRRRRMADSASQSRAEPSCQQGGAAASSDSKGLEV